MDEEKNDKGTETPVNAEDEGVQPTADEQVKQLNEDTEAINKAIAENENAKARQKMSGVAEAGKPSVKEKEESNKDYRARVEKELAAGKTDFSKDGN